MSKKLAITIATLGSIIAGSTFAHATTSPSFGPSAPSTTVPAPPSLLLAAGQFGGTFQLAGHRGHKAYRYIRYCKRWIWYNHHKRCAEWGSRKVYY